MRKNIVPILIMVGAFVSLASCSDNYEQEGDVSLFSQRVMSLSEKYGIPIVIGENNNDYSDVALSKIESKVCELSLKDMDEMYLLLMDDDCVIASIFDRPCYSPLPKEQYPSGSLVLDQLTYSLLPCDVTLSWSGGNYDPNIGFGISASCDQPYHISGGNVIHGFCFPNDTIKINGSFTVYCHDYDYDLFGNRVFIDYDRHFVLSGYTFLSSGGTQHIQVTSNSMDL